jgi:hypothetical protein
MTVKKSVLAQRLAELMTAAGEPTDPLELEKYTVQKLHYEIQKLEEKAPEPEPEPEAEPEPEPVKEEKKEKKEKSLWRLISMDDSSSDDEE